MACSCGAQANSTNQGGHQPRVVAPSQREEKVWSKVGVFLLIPVLSLGSSNPLRDTKRSGTDSTLRVGQLLISKGGPKVVKMAQSRMKNFFDLQLAMRQLEVSMKEMESGLKEVPLKAMSLGMQLDWMGSAWSEVTECYNCLGVFMQDEQAKVKPIASGELQALYEDLLDRVWRALKDLRLAKAAKVAEPPTAMDKAGKPQEPVAKKIVKESAIGETISKEKPKKKN